LVALVERITSRYPRERPNAASIVHELMALEISAIGGVRVAA
jgi:hypothetical protein